MIGYNEINNNLTCPQKATVDVYSIRTRPPRYFALHLTPENGYGLFWKSFAFSGLFSVKWQKIGQLTGAKTLFISFKTCLTSRTEQSTIVVITMSTDSSLTSGRFSPSASKICSNLISGNLLAFSPKVFWKNGLGSTAMTRAFLG